jgi:peptide/histidine transporter 3/4
VNFFSDRMLFEKAAAAATVQSWSGACYATALIGAVVADSALGRFRTILLFSSIYVVGLLILSCCAGLVPAWSPADGEAPSRLQVTLLFVGLYTVALATGGIKPNVSAFGADQFDSSNPTHVRQKVSFFSWFYMSVNVGSLLASSAVVYIQENVSWKVGFLVPTCAMGAALLFFILGSGRYRHAARPPGAQSPITRALAVVTTAALARLDEVLCCRRRVRRTLTQGASGGGGLGSTSEGAGPAYTPPASPLVDAEAAAATSPLADGAAGEVPRLQRWLRLATHDYGGKFTELQVEEVAMVVALLPVMCTSVVYWLVYAQMGSVFVQQGAQMDRRLGSILLPSASMTTCDTLAVVLLIPLLDAVIRWRAETGRPKLMPLQRTGAGHLCAVAAMLTAAALEHFRLDAAWKGQLVSPEDADGATDVVAISILWQAPQYILIGASEVLAAIAQLEFFYSSSPESMRSCAMALQLAANAAGGFLASGLLSAVASITQRLGTPWFTQDLNDGRLDLFFLLLAGLMFVDFLAFTLVASRKVYARATLAQAQASLDRERARVAARASRPPRPPIMRSDPVRVVRDAVTRVAAGGLPQSFSAGSFLGAARGSLVPRTDVPAHLM